MTTATQHIVALPNSIVENKPDEFLTEQFSLYSRNMQFYNYLCQGRGGLSKFNSTALLGKVLAQAKYVDLDGNIFFVICTSKDIYSYDFSASRFDILNILYTTGTITISAGSLTTVTGSGTAWLANLSAGDYIKIGAAAVHTGSTWYEIKSVDSDTQLTLQTNAVACADSDYVARKVFDSTALGWDWTQFSDDAKGEVLLMTNGKPGGYVYWTGSGQVELVTLPASVIACRYIISYAEKVLIAYTTEGGANQRQRIRWSATANCLSYDDLDFQDLPDEPTGITRLIKFNNYHIVFKEKEAYVGRYVGGDYYFAWDLSSQAYGCKAPFSAVARNDYVYYYGHDQKFHRFNLLQDEIISEEIFPDTKNFSPSIDTLIIGYNNPRYNEIRWFCPYGDPAYNNYVVVWNYQQNIIQIWEYESEQACCSFGSFFRTDNIYADDAIYGAQYADETSGYVDDTTGSADAEVYTYGGYDGYIRMCDQGYMDDGEAYTRTFRFKRLNFGLMDKIKRLWKQIFWLTAQAQGDVTIKMRVSDKEDYLAETKTISLVPSEDSAVMIKAPITWDKHSQNFQPEISSEDHFALVAVESLYFPKKRSYDV